MQIQPVRMSWALILFLGMVTAFDAMAIDIYLPAFPLLAEHFGVAPSRIQATLAVFLIGLAVGQALFGPLLDRYGRRTPLLIGIALFTAGSGMAAGSGSLEMLLVARFVQAIGGAAALIAPRAIVSDLCEPKESARIFSMLMQVVAVTPLVAPLLGSVILSVMGWRAIFWVLTAVGALALVLGLALVAETRPPEQRGHAGIVTAFASYGKLLRHPRYMRDSMVGGRIMAALFAYIAGSPFALAGTYGVSPGVYSLLFAAGGLTMIAAAQLNLLALRHLTVRQVTRRALIALAVAAPTLLVASMMDAPLLIFVGLLWTTVACMSFVFGNNMAEAMAHVPDNAGSASAMLGVVQYAMGAVAGGLSVALVPDPRVSIGLVMSLFAVAALVIDNLRGICPAQQSSPS